MAFTTIFLCVEQIEESIAKRKEKPTEILGQIFLVYLEILLQSILWLLGRALQKPKMEASFLFL